MTNAWWVIGETLKARQQDIRSLFARGYLRDERRGSRRRRSRRPADQEYACGQQAPCC